MAFSLDPYSSRTSFETAMDYMQKEMEYKFRKLQDNLRYSNNQQMYVQARADDGTVYQMSNVQPIPETKDQKEAKERAKKLRNLIAYYYSR